MSIGCFWLFSCFFLLAGTRLARASKKTTTTTTTRRPRTLDEIRVHSVTTLLNNLAWSPSVQGVTLPDYAVEVLDPSLPGGSLKLVTTNATFHGFKDMAVTWSELIDYPGVLTLKLRVYTPAAGNVSATAKVFNHATSKYDTASLQITLGTAKISFSLSQLKGNSYGEDGYADIEELRMKTYSVPQKFRTDTFKKAVAKLVETKLWRSTISATVKRLWRISFLKMD